MFERLRKKMEKEKEKNPGMIRQDDAEGEELYLREMALCG